MRDTPGSWLVMPVLSLLLPYDRRGEEVKFLEEVARRSHAVNTIENVLVYLVS